jgi:hypothetical protein
MADAQDAASLVEYLTFHQNILDKLGPMLATLDFQKGIDLAQRTLTTEAPDESMKEVLRRFQRDMQALATLDRVWRESGRACRCDSCERVRREKCGGMQ